MNDIDKAFSRWMEIFKEERPDIVYNQFGKNLPPHAFTAGVEYGTKQARIKTLEEVKWKCLGSPDRNIRKWVDTELEKLKK